MSQIDLYKNYSHACTKKKKEKSLEITVQKIKNPCKINAIS